MVDYSSSKRFFIPHVGDEYEIGINGKRILVIGASFYCIKKDCPYFTDCTNTDKKDSSYYDLICPFKEGDDLKHEPQYAIEDYDQYKVYLNFSRALQPLVENDTDVWKRLAYTNYVQFFLPSFRTKKSYLSDRDFDAFNETVIQLKPDVIITWGVDTIGALRDSNPYVYDKDKLADSDWYIAHMIIPGVDHDITCINCYHPSHRAWHQDVESFLYYFKKSIGLDAH